ncbi:peptidoglycan-associated lipoprotein [Granulicella rosea]|uniref:Peptidoglycan-associated lipoprotein n=1 Tax=Granulicella rosea TaxID=474952 RepID=A0A239DGC0_9BACT|nr:peptidoglycan-associated lipoprotein Pal [Granulicella rosea]SNS31389.1 peptidoglycan-associated lipoprotein [Granulicella rosea]
MNTEHSRKRLIAVALTAMLALAGCHKKAVPPPPPPPPPPPVPTASITASPVAILSGQTTTLTWTTSNATQVTISGLGTVAATGSRSVAPSRSTDYTVTASGAAGASVQASTRVTVTQPPPPPAPTAPPTMSEEEFFAQHVKDIYFNYDRFDLRAEDKPAVEQDVAFLQSHPRMKILIEGHCDDRGSEEYNLALGQSRAESLKKELIAQGLDASRIKVVSFGSEKPFCTEDNDACWQQNRRDHLKLDR